ncbi:MAG: SDR family oxidoreductase, partial [Armatimonadetes bacterium]|nr:SDR family oxidoreductase [Armatimonadota bacterium]
MQPQETEPTLTPLVFVTGGASGIGLAVVQAAAARGWRAIAADADPARLEVARAASGADTAVSWERLDVTDEAAVIECLSRVEAELGPLTGVVNSAGIARDVPCLETSTELFRQVLEVNLLGTFVVAREAARRMVPRGHGAIVNIASISGIRGNMGRAAYGPSKAGVISLTQVLAAELGRSGIRVNAVAPGAIDTPLTRDLLTPEFRAGWARQT